MGWGGWSEGPLENSSLSGFGSTLRSSVLSEGRLSLLLLSMDEYGLPQPQTPDRVTHRLSGHLFVLLNRLLDLVPWQQIPVALRPGLLSSSTTFTL